VGALVNRLPGRHEATSLGIYGRRAKYYHVAYVIALPAGARRHLERTAAFP